MDSKFQGWPRNDNSNKETHVFLDLWFEFARYFIFNPPNGFIEKMQN